MIHSGIMEELMAKKENQAVLGGSRPTWMKVLKKVYVRRYTNHHSRIF